MTLETLVLDGRIHPQRIEDAYERAKAEVEELCLRAARGRPRRGRYPRDAPGARCAARTAAVPHQLRPERARAPRRDAPISPGSMAAELRLDARDRQALGVAARHRQGAHPRGGGLSRDRRCGDGASLRRVRRGRPRDRGAPQRGRTALDRGASSPRQPTRFPVVGPAPGAKVVESYVKRLERIEEIASDRPGVEKVFAMQAGREVRVMVVPDVVDDLAAQASPRTSPSRSRKS